MNTETATRDLRFWECGYYYVASLESWTGIRMKVYLPEGAAGWCERLRFHRGDHRTPTHPQGDEG